MAIAECGRFVCAAGGRSEREQQRSLNAGSVEKQYGWGVPAQLWCASPSADRDSETEVEGERDGSARRAAKRPRTTSVAEASRDNMVRLDEENCDLEWLSNGAGEKDKC